MTIHATCSIKCFANTTAHVSNTVTVLTVLDLIEILTQMTALRAAILISQQQPPIHARTRATLAYFHLGTMEWSTMSVPTLIAIQEDYGVQQRLRQTASQKN